MSTLADVEIARYALGAGFPRSEAVTAVAVALAESGGDPASHNDNAATGDDSYGLWQINMLGGLGAPRRREFGIARNQELLQPAVNARAAFLVWKDAGRRWLPWSTWKHGSHRQFLGRAERAVEAVGRPAPGPVPSGAVVLRRFLRLRRFPRMFGADVRAVQRATGCKADGWFRPVTDAHVRTAQRAHHLVVDGIVGPQTAEALGLTWQGP